MRHLKDHRKLGRTTPHREAMFRNMLVSLIQHERIETTLPKAKELRRIADRAVTWGKKGGIVFRRRARVMINSREALSKLFDVLAPRFAKRQGGYTRIMKLGFRQGDQASMALIEYLDRPVKEPKVKKPKKDKETKAK